MSIIAPAPLRLAIVGTMFGAYGAAAAARQVEGVEVVALCGTDAERTAVRAREYNIPRAYTSWQTMLDEVKPDLCAIITPPHASGDICEAALTRGIGVMVEKLPAVEFVQTQKLAALAERNNVANVVNYIYPQLHTFRAVADWLRERRIGAPLFVRVDWRFESYDVRRQSDSWKLDPARGGGLLAFFLSHTLYYCEHLFGRAEVASARCSDITGGDGETLATVLLQTTNGISIHINACNALPETHEHAVTVSGAAGRIVLKNTGSDPVRDFTAECFDRHGNCIAMAAEKDYNPDDKTIDSRAYPVARMLENLRDQYLKAPESFYAPRLRDAARVHQWVEIIRRSNQTKEAIHVKPA